MYKDARIENLQLIVRQGNDLHRLGHDEFTNGQPPDAIRLEHQLTKSGRVAMLSGENDAFELIVARIQKT